jgi:hypothetical protein
MANGTLVSALAMRACESALNTDPGGRSLLQQPLLEELPVLALCLPSPNQAGNSSLLLPHGFFRPWVEASELKAGLFCFANSVCVCVCVCVLFSAPQLDLQASPETQHGFCRGN